MVDAVVEEYDEAGRARDDTFYETVGRAASYAAAGRILNYVAVDAAEHDRADRNDLASVYRVQMAQMEMGVAHAFLDLLGPASLLEESRGDYQLAGGLLSTIGGGSLEMQLNNVARFALGLPRGV
jgi:alkylation response protein AidB-like acyl-CoA dehydrogenase